ncbi:putative uncharacterized protein C8orf44 [Plecturocebus cupreus]
MPDYTHRQDFALFPRLEWWHVITAHCSLELLAPVILLPQLLGDGSYYVVQAGLLFLGSRDPPASASQCWDYRHEPLCPTLRYTFKGQPKSRVVSIQVKGFDKLLQADVWQQVEDVLQLVDDLVVDGQLPCGYFFQVAPDIQKLGVQSLQTMDLHCGRPRRVDHLRSGVRDQPGQPGETLSLLKLQKLARHVATQEAETGELPEPRKQRLQSAEIVPLYSSLGDRAKNMYISGWVWWLMPVISGLWYAESSRPAWVTWRNPTSTKNTKTSQEVEVAVNRDHATVLQPEQQKKGFHHVAHAGLELLSSSNPPTSAFKSARITDFGKTNFGKTK